MEGTEEGKKEKKKRMNYFKSIFKLVNFFPTQSHVLEYYDGNRKLGKNSRTVSRNIEKCTQKGHTICLQVKMQLKSSFLGQRKSQR